MAELVDRLAVPLERSLGLPLTVYGLGVTIGAGIYMSWSAPRRRRPGFQALLSFILAVLVTAPSAAVFAWLASRCS